jgi:hypothetical protein
MIAVVSQKEKPSGFLPLGFWVSSKFALSTSSRRQPLDKIYSIEINQLITETASPG